MKCLMLAMTACALALTGCAEDAVRSQSGQTTQPSSREDAPTGSLIKKRPNTSSTAVYDAARIQTLAANRAEGLVVMG